MKVVGYCRLSRDEDKENYSSIDEQKIILQDYAISRGWKISENDFYVDDNVSGYTLDRPDFSRMLRKVQRGDIDVVLAKDLSRIGRNNGKVLVLIDEFKAMQKNLILVSEMGGSYDVLNDRDDTIGITTWYNERYVKDCSKKTRDHMLSKQKTGRLIMGNYYGYVKDPNDCTKLTVDEELRPVIELVFKLYIDGNGMKKISDILNENYNYPTPSVYYQKKHLERGRIYKHPVQELWSDYMIKNIIGNDVYCGTLRTHKKKTISIRGKAIKLPESEHFIFENHHEAIVSKETFQSANDIRNRRATTNRQCGKPKRNYFFGGLCRCAECGMSASGMVLRRKNNVKAYECNDYKKYGTKRCKGHEILEEDMWFQFKDFLKNTKKVYLDEIKKINVQNKKNTMQSNKRKLQMELDQANLEYKMILTQKIKDMAIRAEPRAKSDYS
ncbi:MAG: recombinase family protein [Clostridia bacterium]|nr:recombinase family protein [Clostridia bacterium]